MSRSRSATCSAVIALALVAALSACTGESPAPEPASSSSLPTSAPAPVATPEPEPELVPAGTPDDNLPYFDAVNSAFLAGGNPGGGPIIDNLVAAGFDKAAMQVTADKTPIGGTVDSLIFSVQFGDGCLIGQIGAGGYTSMAGPALATGGCLVGNTRSIDW